MAGATWYDAQKLATKALKAYRRADDAFDDESMQKTLRMAQRSIKTAVKLDPRPLGELRE